MSPSPRSFSTGFLSFLANGPRVFARSTRDPTRPPRRTGTTGRAHGRGGRGGLEPTGDTRSTRHAASLARTPPSLQPARRRKYALAKCEASDGGLAALREARISVLFCAVIFDAAERPKDRAIGGRSVSGHLAGPSLRSG